MWLLAPRFASVGVQSECLRRRWLISAGSASSRSRSTRTARTGSHSPAWSRSRAPCDAAASWGDKDPARFFAEAFEAVQVGEGAAFATGYFEPEIAGTRTRQPGFEVPVYGRPSDLVDVDLSQFSPEWAGKKIRGKVKGSDFVPYDDRTQIEQGSLNGRAPIIAWAADEVITSMITIW